jgi:hypothetical protein
MTDSGGMMKKLRIGHTVIEAEPTHLRLGLRWGLWLEAPSAVRSGSVKVRALVLPMLIEARGRVAAICAPLWLWQIALTSKYLSCHQRLYHPLPFIVGIGRLIT